MWWTKVFKLPGRSGVYSSLLEHNARSEEHAETAFWRMNNIIPGILFSWSPLMFLTFLVSVPILPQYPHGRILSTQTLWRSQVLNGTIWCCQHKRIISWYSLGSTGSDFKGYQPLWQKSFMRNQPDNIKRPSAVLTMSSSGMILV